MHCQHCRHHRLQEFYFALVTMVKAVCAHFSVVKVAASSTLFWLIKFKLSSGKAIMLFNFSFRSEILAASNEKPFSLGERKASAAPTSELNIIGKPLAAYSCTTTAQ